MRMVRTWRHAGVAAAVLFLGGCAPGLGSDQQPEGQSAGADGSQSSGSDRAIADEPSGQAPARPRVAFSEIMYHPVLEDAADDNHEFIELFNPGGAAVSLSRWTLVGKGGLAYRFPEAAVIGP